MNVDKIFEAVGKASKLVHAEHKRKEKLEQLRSVKAKRCGNCYHWMKSSCRPEKELGQFKSCNSIACKDFEYEDNGLKEKFKNELDEIEETINELVSSPQ